jgi:hypothetical protein
MSTTLNDVELLTRDYTGTYSTGTLDTNKVYRAIDRAIEYVKREVSFPNDEKRFQFKFSNDRYYYDLPDDFVEALLLTYREESANNPWNGFTYHDYPDILERAGTLRENRWTIINFNGKRQLMIVGRNQIGQSVLESMDSTDGWAVSDDASDLTQDTNQVFQGVASLAFDVVRASGVATVTRSMSATDLRHIFEKKAEFKLNQYFTDNDVTAITLKVMSSPTDYYIMSAVLTDNDLEFPQDEWFKVAFDTENALIVGSPNAGEIITYQIEYTLPASFVAATDFRIDGLYAVFPEAVNLIYTSNYKGTSAAGVAKKVLNAPTDILAFSDLYDDYADLVAQRAAINLWAQLRGDNNEYVNLVRDFRLNMRSFTKRYPRRRVQGVFRHKLRR